MFFSSSLEEKQFIIVYCVIMSHAIEIKNMASLIVIERITFGSAVMTSQSKELSKWPLKALIFPILKGMIRVVGFRMYKNFEIA